MSASLLVGDSDILTEEWRFRGQCTLLVQKVPAGVPDWDVVAAQAVCTRTGELLDCGCPPLVVAVTCRHMAGVQCSACNDWLNTPFNGGWLTFCFLAAELASSLEALTRLFLLITKPLRVPWGAMILHQGKIPRWMDKACMERSTSQTLKASSPPPGCWPIAPQELIWAFLTLLPEDAWMHHVHATLERRQVPICLMQL